MIGSSSWTLSISFFILLSTDRIRQSDARVDLGGGYLGLAMGQTTCPTASAIACTELDDDWPDLGLSCPIANHDIPRHTLGMMSAMVIQLGHYKSVKKENFPIDECYTTKPNSTVSDYGFVSQGTFDMWFFAHDKCGCQENQAPLCHSRATEDEKCNLRTFTLCKVTKQDEICKPKHHKGWKPIFQIEDDHEFIPFNPKDNRQIFTETQFMFSNLWWNLMELLGFWGAI
ncbi:hypothetical protein O181_020041 [Austropuccinia psidii MF-1]|uniref:Uncharacterized protein n=1 Tax=Austropuccinia psidii MF-1 TaxID=1389203 RepID=A0A9Q3GUG3_9BASI|nr:hypothetical protein [Austropuccinia psidii MF-1]